MPAGTYIPCRHQRRGGQGQARPRRNLPAAGASVVLTPARVVAVAGVPGSGKSTLCAALVRALGDAVSLAMDDYEQMTAMDMDQLARWTAGGADVDALPLPQLAEDLAALRAGHPVRHPVSGAWMQPRRTIIFETQFGRTHRATGALIDSLVWLDLPPDAALARNLRRFLAPLLPTPAPAVEELRWIDGYLDQYLGSVGPLVRWQAERVRPGADLVLDAMLTTPQLLQRLLQHLGV